MARRRRRKVEEEEANLERWLVSYADFVTLLFAFFVVMYSISSVNEGKYRVLSETLNAVFEEVPKSDEPIQVGEITRSIVNQDVIVPIIDEESEDLDETISENKVDQKLIQGADIAEKLEQLLLSSVDKEQIEIHKNGNRIEVRMTSKMLFTSGNARLSSESFPILKKIANVIQASDYAVNIEGHTDNVPINTRTFPSNWELSAARAASVVHFMSRQNIDAYRLAAVGYGENRPVANNRTADGRQKNRRISLILLPRVSDKKIDDIEVFNSDEVIPWSEGPSIKP